MKWRSTGKKTFISSTCIFLLSVQKMVAWAYVCSCPCCKHFTNSIFCLHHFRTNTFLDELNNFAHPFFSQSGVARIFALAWAQLSSMPSPANLQWNFGVNITFDPSCFPKCCKAVSSSWKSVQHPIKYCRDEGSSMMPVWSVLLPLTEWKEVLKVLPDLSNFEHLCESIHPRSHRVWRRPFALPCHPSMIWT